MLSTKTVLCLLFASVAFADINKDFQKVLHGKVALTDSTVMKMYEQFLKEHTDAPSQGLLKGTSVDRREIFANAVKNVIEHNTNKSYKYKKGINSFSDMTD